MEDRTHILLLHDFNSRLRPELRAGLFHAGFDVTEAADGIARASIPANWAPDAIVIATTSDDPSLSISVARRIRAEHASLPLVLVTVRSSQELVLAALKAGINDYFAEPWSISEVAASLRQHIGKSRQRPIQAPSGSDCAKSTTHKSGAPQGLRFIGDSAPIRAIKKAIEDVGPTDSSVVITGETGTGKDLVAQIIHAYSQRQGRRFVAVNCAAIPDSLFESELFGHEKGAFTGAHARRDGQLKFADRGTVFLDEIGDMSPYAQAKLLRVLENKELRRLGAEQAIPVDVRFLAATNRDIERLVSEEKFRSDLYYRLNVARIHVPALRERREDIPLLTENFRHELNLRFGRSLDGIDDDVLSAFLAYDWPGNIRELRNVLEATYITAMNPKITLGDMPEFVRARICSTKSIGEDERSRLIAALRSSNWNMTKAAQHLHWSRMTLYRKAAKYNIVRGGGALRTSERSKL